MLLSGRPQLHEAGITLHVGTDTLNPFVVPGASLWTELRDLTQAGFTPEQAWTAAISGNGDGTARTQARGDRSRRTGGYSGLPR
jgi:hypothetical protein